MNASRQVISRPREATSNVTQPTITATPSGPSKIVDTLKPRCPLNEEMTLEEAQLWFKNYKAHLHTMRMHSQSKKSKSREPCWMSIWIPEWHRH